MSINDSVEVHHLDRQDLPHTWDEISALIGDVLSVRDAMMADNLIALADREMRFVGTR